MLCVVLPSLMLKMENNVGFRITMGLLPREPWEDLEEAIQQLQQDLDDQLIHTYKCLNLNLLSHSGICSCYSL